MQTTLDDGLKPKEARWAALVAQGLSQSDAFRQSHDVLRMKPESIHVAASKLAAKPKIQQRIRDLLKQAHVQDIVTQGEVVKFILEGRERAIMAGNSTAEAAFTLQLTKVTGMNRESVLVGAEKSETDDELVARLSGGDAHKATMLRSIIGKDTFA